MLRIILMLSSIFLILYGWKIESQFISIIGAVAFLCALLVNLFQIYLLSKELKNRKGAEDLTAQRNNNVISILDKVLEGIITAASLIGFVVFQDKSELYLYPPMIIWIGIIAIYFLSGVIIREVGNIPLRMSYGSWKIYYPKSSSKKKS